MHFQKGLVHAHHPTVRFEFVGKQLFEVVINCGALLYILP
jgi:hypothetical protein